MNAKQHVFSLWVITVLLLLTLFAVFQNYPGQQPVSRLSTTNSPTITTSVGQVDELTLRCNGAIRTTYSGTDHFEPVTDLILVVNRTDKRIRGFSSNDETNVDSVNYTFVLFHGKGDIVGNTIFIDGSLNRITRELRATTIYLYDKLIQGYIWELICSARLF
jgi:hypothetical protein